MNIRRVRKKIVATFKLAVLMVLKPAVLAVIDWKKLDRILVERDLPAIDSGLLNSRRKNITAPISIKEAVVIITTFACREKCFTLLKVIISEITGKPIPPSTIKTINIKFRGISELKLCRLLEYREKPALQKALTVWNKLKVIDAFSG